MRIEPLIPLPFVVVILTGCVGLLVACIIFKKWRKKKNFIRIAIGIMMGLILLRPMLTGGINVKQTNNLNLFFVVDSTASMSAKDVGNGEMRRYEQVREDIKKIAKSFKGSRYSIIVEDNSIFTAMPLSSNADMLSSALYGIKPRSYYQSMGTNLDDLITFANERVAKYNRSNPERTSVMFFFSDGEDTNDRPLSTVASIKKAVSGGAVFGYGTEKGATMEENLVTYTPTIIDRPAETQSCIRNYNGCILSKINEKNLESIANTFKVKYYNRTDGGDIPAELINEINESIVYEDDVAYAGATDLYWIFSGIILILLIVDFRDILIRVLKEREIKHA